MSLALPRGTKTGIVWSIAGSDPASAAGLQTDLKTITALGAHGCTIMTALTAQNTAGVTATESVSVGMLKAQIDALRSDLPPRAIKIGMLGNAAGIRLLAEELPSLEAPVIYDPVLRSSSGTRLMDDMAEAAMREKLLPIVDILTPNRVEAEILSGITISSDEDAEKAGQALLFMGPHAVLVKGIERDGYMQDYYCTRTKSHWLTLPKSDAEVPRGTGCALSSAIATALTEGFDRVNAAVIAKAYVHRLFRKNRKLGAGPPIGQHLPWPVEAEDFPWLTDNAEAGRKRPLFTDCGPQPLGFYPVLDSTAWLQQLLPYGIRTAQLRVKNKTGLALDNEIASAIAYARGCNTRLFINDYWQQALQHHAYGVHLGQEDLDTADLDAIAKSGMRLGVSTHSYAELARALALRPSYIALGPIFPTTLKSMKFAPQGVATLRIWRALTSLPLVAIGGIKLEQAAEMFDAGADSVAVVSDITQSSDPDARVKSWLKLTEMRKGSGGERNRFAAVG